MGKGGEQPLPTTVTALLSPLELRVPTWLHDYTFLTAPLSPPSSANGLIGILDSGATGTIVTVEIMVFTAAHGGTLRVTHEGVLGFVYKLIKRLSFDIQYYLCGRCVSTYVCHWGIATSSAQME